MKERTTKSEPSSVHQQNAIQMAFRWHADDGPTLNAGLVAFYFSGLRIRIFVKSYNFMIYGGGGGEGAKPHVPPSGSAHIHADISSDARGR